MAKSKKSQILNEVIAMSRTGAPYTVIAKRFKINPQTARNYVLSAHKTETPTEKKLTPETVVFTATSHNPLSELVDLIVRSGMPSNNKIDALRVVLR